MALGLPLGQGDCVDSTPPRTEARTAWGAEALQIHTGCGHGGSPIPASHYFRAAPEQELATREA
eukprot:5514583-Alexandrium_andersonii.AAC.1